MKRALSVVDVQNVYFTEGLKVIYRTCMLAVSSRAGLITAEELRRATLVTQAMRFSKVMTVQQWIADL